MLNSKPETKTVTGRKEAMNNLSFLYFAAFIEATKLQGAEYKQLSKILRQSNRSMHKSSALEKNMTKCLMPNKNCFRFLKL